MKNVFVMLLVLATGNAFAGAVTIDFEDTLPTYWGLSSYSEDGFSVNSNVASGTLIDDNNTVRANLGIFSGGTNSQTMVWGQNGSASTLTLSGDSGEIFDLLALDASSFYNASGVLTLTGTLSAGGTVVQNLTLNSSLATYLISGMNGLSSLDISFDGASVSAPYDIDNIQMNVVPVPAAIWLLGSALGFLAIGRRRKA